MPLFNELGLTNKTLDAINKKGFEEPTPVQSACIPILLSGEKNMVVQAQTGTGKTAAFALPLIEKLNTDNKFCSSSGTYTNSRTCITSFRRN